MKVQLYLYVFIKMRFKSWMMDKRIEENDQDEKETPQNVDGENFRYFLSAFFELYQFV